MAMGRTFLRYDTETRRYEEVSFEDYFEDIIDSYFEGTKKENEEEKEG